MSWSRNICALRFYLNTHLTWPTFFPLLYLCFFFLPAVFCDLSGLMLLDLYPSWNWAIRWKCFPLLWPNVVLACIITLCHVKALTIITRQQTLWYTCALISKWLADPSCHVALCHNVNINWTMWRKCDCLWTKTVISDSAFSQSIAGRIDRLSGV